MSIVRIRNVDVDLEGTPILRDVNLKLDAGDRIGLVGHNGSGKSTLIKLVTGEVPATVGTVDVDQDAVVGYFSQHSELDGEQTVDEVCDTVFADVRAVEARLAEVEAALGEVTDDAEMTALVDEQAHLFEQMDHLDGWSVGQKVDAVLSMLSFSDEDRARPVGELSGGWRNRAALAQLVLSEPDVLLMDEPTNYLDVVGVEWLEDWFAKYRGALLLVSHDRAFLDTVATTVVEIENRHLHRYDGSYTQYVREKPMRVKDQQRQFVLEEKLLILEAQGLANRAAAGKGTNRKLANVKKGVTPKPVDQVITEIYANLRTKDALCEVRDLAKSREQGLLFKDVGFDIRRRDRLAIVGPNGCGKSTLVSILVGDEDADDGTVEWARGVEFSHFNRVLAELDLDDTVAHAVNAMPPGSLAREATKKQVTRFLTLFRFSELDKQQRLRTLSGGQRARVALAQCLLSGASVVVLDEPTNHLDLPSTQVMESALAHFPGAVVVVSHDRFFLSKLATRTLEFDGEGGVAVR